MPSGVLLMTLAGSSRRFAAEGVSRPKWSLPLGSCSLLEHSLVSADSLLSAGFHPVFVVLEEHQDWLGRSMPSGLPSGSQVVALPSLLPGQALSAAAALGSVDQDAPLVLWDADMLLRPPPLLPHEGSWMLLSRDLPGSEWAFAGVDGSFRLSAVAEREPVGPFMALGMYGFSSARLFSRLASEAASARPDGEEVSVAPLYGRLPSGAARGYLLPASQVFPVGTPALLASSSSALGLSASL